jgi:hypothetical protein
VASEITYEELVRKYIATDRPVMVRDMFSEQQISGSKGGLKSGSISYRQQLEATTHDAFTTRFSSLNVTRLPKVPSHPEETFEFIVNHGQSNDYRGILPLRLD